MKNTFKSFRLILIVFFSFFLSLNFSLAQGLPNFSDVGNLLKNFNQNILGNLVLVLSAVALVVFLAGLVKFIFDRAKGNTENLAKDKKNILWGMVALFILVSLWGIIKMFQVIIGIPNDNTIPIPKICVDGNCQTASSTTNKGAGGNAGGVFEEPSKKLDTGTQVNGNYSESSIKAWPSQFGPGTGIYQYVAELQAFLNKEAGANIVVDGKYGSNTIEAVKAFQTRNKLVADGTVGPSTKAVILYRYIKAASPEYQFVSSWNDLSLGSKGTSVEQLQEFLRENDCYDEDANDDDDGIFGPDTKKAVINFQNTNYLKEDAIVGPSTRAVIMSPDTYGC